MDPSLSSVTDLLKFNTCVKKCPIATGTVECYKTKFMTTNAGYYKDCVYYAYKTAEFRYETTTFGGKFCVPSSEALKNGTIATFQA